MNKKNALRFDHREIAVLFSLFIFVSLLMFTVGILVGKGLTQAKYENQEPGLGETLTKNSHSEPHAGASVSMGAHHEAPDHSEGAGHDAQSTAAAPQATADKGHGDSTHPAAKAAPHSAEPTSADKHDATPHVAAASTESKETQAHASTPSANQGEKTAHAPTTPPESLKLIPLKPSPPVMYGYNLSDPHREAQELLKNPKILSLVERDDKRSPERAPSSARSPAKEESFTVQVGSYPNETAAKERVEALKKLGFTQAYFSANELGSGGGTWYRVWLGHFPSRDSATQMGDKLRARNEVRNYIVRKTR